MKRGYAIVLLDVNDVENYQEYVAKATEIETRHGGVPLVVADAVEVVDGSWPAERVVVIEFPTLNDARAWYADPEYQALVPLRHGATVSNVLLVEGFLPV